MAVSRCFSMVVLLSSLMATGCSTLSSPFTRGERPGPEPLNRISEELAEDQLLDVWIELFQTAALPEDEDEALGLSEDIRDAEARFIPVYLRNTMEKTGYWGAVRVVPRSTAGAEVLVQGTILASDGESLALEITALDATGRRWFSRTYERTLPEDAYRLDVSAGDAGVFDALYNTIANDLSRYRQRLSQREVRGIRQLAELRFAVDLAPAVFAEYLQRRDDGRYALLRLPAVDDPMYHRVQQIRERDFLLIDTLNGHYTNFFREMEIPYDGWRKARGEEVAALRRVEREATTRKVLGFAAIAGAIAIGAMGNRGTRVSTSTLRDVMVLGGAYAIKTGFDKDSETGIHRDAIEELGASFASEARPLVVEVEGQTHELTGSAEVQYAKWRELLHAIYVSETGFVGVVD